MTWQPQTFQPSQQNQSTWTPQSFQPDTDQPESTSLNTQSPNQNSFVQNPTLGNFANSAWQAAKDVPTNMLNSIGDIGDMVYGNKLIIGKSMGETAGNIASLAFPFIGGAPEGVAEKTASTLASTREFAANYNKPTAQQLADISGRVFDAADTAGGALDATDTNSFIDHMRDTARQTPEGNTFRGSGNPINDYADRLESWRDKNLSFSGATDIDNQLTDLINANKNPDTTPTSQGQQWLGVQDKLRELMTPSEETEGNQGFALRRQGQQLWGQSRTLGEVDKIIDESQRSNNPSQTLMSRFNTFSKNARKMNFLSDDEQQAVRDAATRGITGDFFNAFGSRLIGSGLGGAAGSFGGPVGTVLGSMAGYAASGASRNIAEQLQLNRANALRDMVINRHELPDLNIPNTPDQSISGLLSYQPRPFVTNPEGMTSVGPTMETAGPNGFPNFTPTYGQGEGMPYLPNEQQNVNLQSGNYQNMPLNSQMGQNAFNNAMNQPETTGRYGDNKIMLLRSRLPRWMQ